MYIYFHWTRNIELMISVSWWSRVVNLGTVIDDTIRPNTCCKVMLDRA
jgi:hypothetical protein